MINAIFYLSYDIKITLRSHFLDLKIFIQFNINLKTVHTNIQQQ